MVDNQRQRNLDVVRRAFAGIAAGDASQMLDGNYTDDVVIEFPYASPPTRIETLEAARAYLEKAFEVFRFRLEITDVYEGLDPDLLVLEFTSEGRMLSTGAPYGNRYIAVYRFRDGRISHQREFYNPVAASSR